MIRKSLFPNHKSAYQRVLHIHVHSSTVTFSFTIEILMPCHLLAIISPVGSVGIGGLGGAVVEGLVVVVVVDISINSVVSIGVVRSEPPELTSYKRSSSSSSSLPPANIIWWWWMAEWVNITIGEDNLHVRQDPGYASPHPLQILGQLRITEYYIILCNKENPPMKRV